MKKDNRIGERRYNNQGLLMEIIEYNKAIDIKVKFIKSGYICKCRYGNFQRGMVYDKLHPTVCNLGYIGNTTTSENRKPKKSYKIWVDMLHRCYDKLYKTYIDCSVCDEWLCYANFEKWFNENYYEIPNEKMCLDKDILIKGNRIYSPNTCIFAPNNINILFTKNDGYSYVKNKNAYIVYGNDKGKTLYLGYFKTQQEARLIYKKYKENHIKNIANKYKDIIPLKLYHAMITYDV